MESKKYARDEIKHLKLTQNGTSDLRYLIPPSVSWIKWSSNYDGAEFTRNYGLKRRDGDE